MMRVACAALLAVGAMGAIVDRSNTDQILPNGYETSEINVSFMMRCNLQQSTCFTASGNGKDGIFQRSHFFGRFRSSTETIVNKVWKARDPASVEYDSGDLKLSFDRVVTRTDPFHQPEAKATITDDEGKLADVNVPDANTWNVFVRFTVENFPTEVLPHLKEVLLDMEKHYDFRSTKSPHFDILFDSIWSSSEAHFIQDRLAPVVGRGHKDQQLLIPLICGVVAMLVIPALVSFALVSYAKSQKLEEDKLTRRQRTLDSVLDDLNQRKNRLEQYNETARDRAENDAREMDLKKAEDDRELQYDDVDWEAKNLTAEEAQ